MNISEKKVRLNEANLEYVLNMLWVMQEYF
jgi:hypothetical protein